MLVPAICSILCSTLLGFVFLLTGGIKAVAPSSLVRYLFKLGVKGSLRVGSLIWISAVAECVLGSALILRVLPEWLFPGAVLLLAVFSIFTAWSARKGEDDCGCYGQLLSISPAKSLSLNALYAALAIVAWRVPVVGFMAPSTQVAILAGATLLFSTITAFGHRFYRNRGKDWVDLNPLQVGRKWNPDWFDGFQSIVNGEEQLIVLMSPTCPTCKAWMKPLNKISRRADMPQVIGGMAASEDKIRSTVAEHGIIFPVLRVRQSVMDRIAGGYPDVVLIDKGIVRAKPGGRLPDDLLQRLKSSLKSPPLEASGGKN